MMNIFGIEIDVATSEDINRLEAESAALQNDITKLKKDITKLKNNIKELKNDIKDLRKHYESQEAKIKLSLQERDKVLLKKITKCFNLKSKKESPKKTTKSKKK